MPIATLADVKAVGNLSAEIPSEVLQPHLDYATRWLKRIVGASLYAEVAAESGTDRKADFNRAECYLTVHQALPSLNLRSGASGGIELTSHRAIGGGMTSTTRFMMPSELTAARKTWFEMAMNTLKPYLPTAPVAIKKVGCGPE